MKKSLWMSVCLLPSMAHAMSQDINVGIPITDVFKPVSVNQNWASQGTGEDSTALGSTIALPQVDPASVGIARLNTSDGSLVQMCNMGADGALYFNDTTNQLFECNGATGALEETASVSGSGAADLSSYVHTCNPVEYLYGLNVPVADTVAGDAANYLGAEGQSGFMNTSRVYATRSIRIFIEDSSYPKGGYFERNNPYISQTYRITYRLPALTYSSSLSTLNQHTGVVFENENIIMIGRFSCSRNRWLLRELTRYPISMKDKL
ncbi:hypothetical protein ACMXYX_18035 (plasmid) [Neptuniibacter sp. QD72_48]|uniref:hypothetical protein n=1 Tax=Neptuniibacter sp. QD72_48 TaxID=3398214 RepID=UPI0039F552E6